MSSVSSLFGLKPKFQEFTASGTFTPSAALMAAGGVILVHLWGAGGGGGKGHNNGSYGGTGGAGGGSGEYKRKWITLANNNVITITLGTGGSGSSATDGGNSTFGALITATGGKVGGLGVAVGGSSNNANQPPAGVGSYPGTSYGSITGDQGDGGNGGSAVGVGYGGNGGIGGGNNAGGNGGIASGGGGGGGYSSGITNGGNGGAGFCRVEWWE